MTGLAALLIVKIGVTAVTIVLPLLIRPADELHETFDFGAPDLMLYRLYGVALAALLVAYGAGLAAVLAGTVPWGTLWMGLVSNGGAAGVMVLTGYWRRAVLGLAFF
ncbi:MAG: hypothetical protein AAGF60_13420, partial [Pseudomonadota bacterium]